MTQNDMPDVIYAGKPEFDGSGTLDRDLDFVLERGEIMDVTKYHKSPPVVDVEALKKHTKVDCEHVGGWNACLDHLRAEGIILVKAHALKAGEYSTKSIHMSNYSPFVHVLDSVRCGAELDGIREGNKMELEKLYSLYNKADERLLKACFIDEYEGTSVFRGAVLRKLTDKILDAGGTTLNTGLGYVSKVTYNVRILRDKSGVRFDKRTLPKDLKQWVDCPYEAEWLLDLKENKSLKVGQSWVCVVSYHMTEGTYEYPYDCDLCLTLHRYHPQN